MKFGLCAAFTAAAASTPTLTVGIGVGYLETELNTFGVSLADRAATTDEYLDALLTLWDGHAPTIEGTHVTFRDVAQAPRPALQPHPPLALRRPHLGGLAIGVALIDGRVVARCA